MTLIDEDVLIDALNDAANTFEVSKEASTRILAEARPSGPPRRPRQVPTFIGQPSRGRTYSVAAVLVMIVAGISIPLFRSEGNPNRLSATGSLGTAHSSQGNVVPKSPSPDTNGTGTVGGIASSGLKSTTVSGTTFTGGAANTSQKIESTGTIGLAVNKGQVKSAFSRLSQFARSDGGFVDSTNANAGSGAPGKFVFGTIAVQVPQRNFAKLVSQAQSVGNTTSVRTSSSDVTAQYVDLEAHVAALEASRRQYLVIMTKATTIDGILAVQSQLDALQSQIEQLQGQLNVLSHETTYGALTVMVSEKGHHAPTTSPLSGFAKAWHDSVKGFLAGFEWLVRLAGPALFAVLALCGAWVFGRYARRTIRRRRI
jgi:DNA-binding protein YbaB